METMRFQITINADREKVWHTMLDDKTYRKWVAPFMEGSYYEGSWEKGSEIKFLMTDEEGKTGGMYSRIAESIKYEYVSIEHLGMIADGVIDTTSEEVKKWTPAFENYALSEKDGKTLLKVESDITPEYKEMFEKIWPKALAILKTLSEA